MVTTQKNKGRKKWLETGYRHFAESGPENLSINKLSKELGSARASFYHYFGDLDVFIDELLAMHWKIAVDFNRRGKTECKQLFPDLYSLLAEHPVPLKFSIQLFRHRNTPAYNYLFIKTYESSAKEFILSLFAKEFNLVQPEGEMLKLWTTVGETWYSRLTLEDLSAGTLQKHAEEILDSVVQFARSQLYSQFHLQT
jgi:AcrR family transcriptional regulator